MKKNKKQLKQIQFFRFYAFLFVFLHHADTYSTTLPFVTAYPCMRSVGFFFAISGFLTGYNNYGNEIDCSWQEACSFIAKKIKKFYPVYFFALLFSVMFSQIPYCIATFDFDGAASGIIEFLKHAILLQAWIPSGYFSFYAVGWFLSALVFLTILSAPLLCVIEKMDKKKNADIFLGISVVLSVAVTFLYCWLFRNRLHEYWLHVFPPANLGNYFGAMVLGYLFSKYNAYFDNSNSLLFSLLEVMAIVLWFLSAFVFTPPVQWMDRIAYWVIPNYIVISVFAVGKGAISRLLQRKALVYLGNISMECFLIHTLILRTYHALSGDYGGISILGNCFSLLFCLMLTIILASLIHGLPKKENKNPGISKK